MKDPLLRAQRRIKPLLRDRRTIASAAAVCGTTLVCYLYVLAGNINNYDNMACTPAGYGTGLRSGRWLLVGRVGALRPDEVGSINNMDLE